MSLPSPTSSISTYPITNQLQATPFIGSNSIKFLGMNIQVSTDLSGTERVICFCGFCLSKTQTKVHLYIAGISPYLSWLLIIKKLPITLVQRYLDAKTTQFVKKWAGLHSQPTCDCSTTPPPPPPKKK